MRRVYPVCCLLLTIVAVLAAACRNAPGSHPQLQALVAGDGAPAGAISEEVWKDVQAFYAGREHMLAWSDSEGPTDTGAAALETLHAATSHGLDPADYHEPELRKASSELQAVEQKDDEFHQRLAEYDVRATAALLQLARHVATGRLEPSVIDHRWNVRREAPDYVAALQSAVTGTMTTFLDNVRPRHPEYAALQNALAAVRSRAAKEWPQVPRATLKLGGSDPKVVPLLRRRLTASGELGPDAPLESPRFDGEVQRALRVFQEHHALEPTGELDAATVAKLNVSPRARITQLEMNLERWRWLPDDLGERHFMVNVPYFHLIARESGQAVMDIRVVVGKRGNETPLFSDEMETVVFSPYWNIPETIALEETAPAIASDPDYLARNNMEIVDRAGDVVPADEVPWDDEGALADYRFRQRPGANNALGFVKFLFPNRHAVYLHDTPADALFKRIGRAFSHGCVRVEEPETLAKYVLRDQSTWTADAIHAAMRAGTERHVRLSEPIPVHIVYLTAFVDENGGLHFLDDVYGYDAKQARAQ